LIPKEIFSKSTLSPKDLEMFSTDK